MYREAITDDYDRRAYEQILRTMQKAPSRASQFGSRVGERIRPVGERFTKRIPAVVSDGFESVFIAALSGLRSITIDPALRSVVSSRVVNAYAKDDPGIRGLVEISNLPLETIDRVTPGLHWRYAIVAAVEGAATGAVITGAELVAVGGTVASAGVAAVPGAGTVIGAMALDTALVLAASARVVAHIGAYHGYDTRLKQEELFALSVINWSTSISATAKSEAFRQLSQLTQQLARGATWIKLNEHAFVRATTKVFEQLGFKLTKEKLGQAIPVIGMALGAGLNAQMVRSVAIDASLAYRMRHLMEKYNLSPEAAVGNNRQADEVDSIDITGIIEEAIEESNSLGADEHRPPEVSA